MYSGLRLSTGGLGPKPLVIAARPFDVSGIRQAVSRSGHQEGTKYASVAILAASETQKLYSDADLVQVSPLSAHYRDLLLGGSPDTRD